MYMYIVSDIILLQNLGQIIFLGVPIRKFRKAPEVGVGLGVLPG